MNNQITYKLLFIGGIVLIFSKIKIKKITIRVKINSKQSRKPKKKEFPNVICFLIIR